MSSLSWGKTLSAFVTESVKKFGQKDLECKSSKPREMRLLLNIGTTVLIASSVSRLGYVHIQLAPFRIY